MVARVLDLRLRIHWFEIHSRHCVVSLSKTIYPLLSTGSTQEVSEDDSKIDDWDEKHQ